MEMTIRSFDGCPHRDEAERRVREALRRVGLAETAVARETVASAEEADRLGFRGSPTILIDGRDPWADPDAPVGFACRLYQTPRGREGAPSIAQIVAALQPGDER